MSNQGCVITYIPAPPGWQACYLGDDDEEDCDYATLPIAVWAVLDCPDEAGRMQRVIRPYVARSTGEIVDYSHVEREFLCLVSPGFDPHKVVTAILARDIETTPPAGTLLS